MTETYSDDFLKVLFGRLTVHWAYDNDFTYQNEPDYITSAEISTKISTFVSNEFLSGFNIDADERTDIVSALQGYASGYKAYDAGTTLSGARVLIFDRGDGSEPYAAISGWDTDYENNLGETIGDTINVGLSIIGLPSVQVFEIASVIQNFKDNHTQYQDKAFDFWGHSLGGVDTLLMNVFFPSLVNKSYTFNSVGVGGIATEALNILTFGAVQNLFDSNDNIINFMQDSDIAGLTGIVIGNTVHIPDSTDGVSIYGDHVTGDIETFLNAMVNNTTIPNGFSAVVSDLGVNQATVWAGLKLYQGAVNNGYTSQSDWSYQNNGDGTVTATRVSTYATDEGNVYTSVDSHLQDDQGVKIGGSGQSYISGVNADGEQILQVESDENSDGQLSQKISVYNGDEQYLANVDNGALGVVIKVPEDELIPQEVVNFASSYLSNLLVDDPDTLEGILYSAYIKAATQHAAIFANFIADGYGIGTSFSIASGVHFPGFDSPEFMETYFSAVQSKVIALAAGKIVDEFGETLGIDYTTFIGGVVETAADQLTISFLGETIDIVFAGMDSSVFSGIADGGFFTKPVLDSQGNQIYKIGDQVVSPDTPGAKAQFESIDMQALVLNALGSYVGGRLAGEVIEAESEHAAIMGSLGSAIGTFVAGTSAAAGSSLAALQTALQLGTAFGPVGIAVGAFIGTIAGTALGNAIGGEDHPSAFGAIRYDYDNDTFYTKFITTNDGGPAELAESMAAQVSAGVNSILESTGGALRHTSVAEALQIGIREGVFTVDILDGATHTFGSAGDAVEFAAFHILKSHDLVGGSAVVMRAWHNTEATNMAEWREDIEVAEAFQQYLLNPTGILALMMDQPESELAQSWAAILQRAAELELHLPHEKDLDGGWNELLLARGDHDPGSIPTIEGDSIVLTDPVTGEETVLHHVIGPGYEIVRIEGTDGDDIIQVIVDGSSITYVDAGAGNDTVEGSDERDIILGGAGDDTINGNDGDDWINGGSGDDTLHGNGGLDLLYGGDDNDTLYGDEDGDAVYGGQGDDTLYGLDGADELFGGAGDDTLDGGDGVDLVKGEAGNDILISNGGGDTLDGGLGDDTYYLNGSGDTITITRESGHEIIYGNSLGSNTIKFDKTISIYEVWFEASGDDLLIKILGEDQSLLIKNLFAPQDPSLFKFEQINTLNISGSNGLHNNSSALWQVAHDHETYAGKPTGQYNYMSDSDLAGSSYKSIVWAHPSSDDRFFGTNGDDVYQMPRINEGIAGPVTFGAAGDDDLGTAENSHYYQTYDFIYGDSGNDHIWGSYGHDTLIGGLGDDTIEGGERNDLIYGGHGNDSLFGHDDHDEIHGGQGNDYIVGDYGNDKLYGDDGDDTITDLQGNNEIYGGAGNDIIAITNSGSGDNFIDGGDGSDMITSSAGNDTVLGGNGDDIIDAGAGSDLIDGGAGDDRLIYNYAENVGDQDEYVGGEGNDTLVINLTAAEFALDTMQRDLLRFQARVNSSINTTTSTFLAFAFALQALGASAVEAMEIVVDGNIEDFSYEDITGTTASETLNGSATHDHIMGDEGDDTLNGGAGHDFLEGGDGDDILHGDEGVDDISGGAGSDTISGGDDEDIIDGGDGDDTIAGDAGADIINAGDGADTVDGGSEDDVIYGGRDNDTLDGGDGDDELYGESGNDTLSGGEGNDLLNGGTGNDILVGGLGDDYLDGGIGDDEYVFNLGDGHDTINDVSGTGDFIRFGSGVVQSEISIGIKADNSFELSFVQSVNDLITIENQGTIEDPRLSIEKLIFENGGAYNLSVNAQDDNAQTERGASITLDILTNDSDILQNLLTISQVSMASNGTVVMNTDGSITYTPNAGFIGQDVFTYGVLDWFGGLGSATVSIDVLINEIIGTSTNDTLVGTEKNDDFYGGAGNDTLIGGLGDDMYFFGLGDGHDTINETGGADSIILGDNIAFHDVIVTAVDVATREFLITFNNSPDDSITYFSNSDNSLENLVFADGSSFALTAIHGTASNETVYGTSASEMIFGYGGTDTLYGYGGDDILDGGAGYSIYQGGAGDDIYIWDPQNGNVLLFEDTVTGDLGYDVIRIHGMNIDEITPQLYNGNEDLLVYNDDNSNYLRVAYQYYTETRGGDFDARKVEKIILDDGSEIEVSSRYSFTYKGADGDDTITSGSMSDTLIGGAGDDTLYGGGGADVAVFNGNYGWYTITDNTTYLTVADNIGDDGTDTVYSDVEKLVFADGEYVGGVFTSNSPLPVAHEDSFSGDEDAVIIGNVMADNGNGADSDPEGDALAVIAETITTAAGATVIISANGDFTYSPLADAYGSDSFEYVLVDEHYASATGTVSITLNASYDAAQAVDDIVSAQYDAATVIDVLANDDNPDDGTLVISGLGTAINGTVVDNGNGTVTYTPNSGYIGSDSFTYTITDAGNTITQAIVNVTVDLPTIHGTNSGENLYGTSASEAMNGLGGNDWLRGYGGDDILDGGSGTDWLLGGTGDDTYIWNPSLGSVIMFDDDTGTDLGHDIIKIQGMTMDEVTLQPYNGNEDLVIYNDDNSNYLRVAYQYYTEARGGNYDSRKIEKVVFDDGAEIDIEDNYTYTYKGSTGDDIIGSGSSADTLIGGAGDDTLYGGGGADIFVFDSFMGIDTVGDFNTSQGDKIDIADLLSGYDPLSDAISDFVQITDDGTNSTIAVDADGGADNYVTVATLLNAAGLTNEDALESSGTLITV